MCNVYKAKAARTYAGGTTEGWSEGKNDDGDPLG